MGIHHQKKYKRKAERTGASCSATDAKMQEGDQDYFMQSDILPDDLSEFLDDNFLVSFLDPNALDKAFSSINMDDISETETLCPPDLIEPNKPPGNSKKRKRQRPEERTRRDNNHTTKKARATGKPKPQEHHSNNPFLLRSDAESGVSPEGGRTDLTDTPPKILRLSPPQAAAPIPIQIIAIPEHSGYQLVQLPPPNSSVIRLPLPNTSTTPTFILVPVDSPPCNRQIPPLSPVDGAVAPILMSSSPPGSLSDTASKAMSPSRVSLRSPSCDQSPVKEPPQSPSIPDIPQRVKDYVQAAKSHMYQLCLEMEEGLSITSHYVEQHVSQREVYRSGKTINKCLDKEFAITGHTHRQKNSLKLNQIFESSNGERSKHCILLLGNAGMGKTTLIKKLCLDWSRDSFPQFDFVFLLDGKGLTLTEPVHSLQTLLFDLSSVTPCCVDTDEVYVQVLAAPKRVLLIFDGFDELRDYESLLQTQEKECVTLLQKDSKMQTFTVRQLYSAILQRLLLPGCTLLLSSRPRGACSQLLRRVDALLEVCGFTSDSIDTYLTHYFTDPDSRASALDCLKSSSYLHHLCWNPGLCRLACMVLEHGRCSKDLPRTLTELCHQVVSLKMEKHARNLTVCGSAQAGTSAESTQHSPTELSKTSQGRTRRNKSQTKTSGRVSTAAHMQKSRKAKELGKQEDDKNVYNQSKDADERENKALLLQLCALAWEGVKASSSSIPRNQAVPTKVKVFGISMGVLRPQNLRRRRLSNGETDNRNKEEKRLEGQSEKKGDNISNVDCKDLILVWTSPFLQSYLAAVHLSLSRIVSDRSFLQALPFQMGAKCRRRPKREELELTQRIVVGLLFYKKEKLQLLHSLTETAFRNTLTSRQGLVAKHLEGLSYSNLVSAQVLELCHYVYEASVSQESSGRDTGGTKLAIQLAENLPESLRFNGVPLSPPDVFAMKDALQRGAAEERSFSLDLENTGIQISGLRALVSLNNINSFRACIADVISLWEQLEQSGEEELLQGAVSKFHIHPLKATQVCHIEHLEKLVNIHMNKRLSESSRLSDSILADGVPAVKDLHKLEFELGSEEGPLALPKLWNLLPGLHNLQHLDLEESKIEDKGAEKLAMVLNSLTSLEVLNLSQNCIGDHGVKKLALALKDLPKLHCLSLYSNEIADEGAESLAAVLPHMPSLTHLDVGYNKLRDVGAQSLALSLKNCKKAKALRMWNQCIPYGVFERLQRQDSRILSL